MKKTLVVTNSNDQRHSDWKKGDKGYVDGYVNGADGTPYAVVIIEFKAVLIPLNCLIYAN